MKRLWYNGKVVSMDAAMTRYEAIGTEDGRIVYLGTDAGAQGQARDEQRDLAGAMVLPALGLKPVSQAGMCLGEGTGAVAALPLFQMAADVYSQMSTFQENSIQEYQEFSHA